MIWSLLPAKALKMRVFLFQYYSMEGSAIYTGPVHGGDSDTERDTYSSFGFALLNIILSALSFLELLNSSHISRIPTRYYF